MCENISSLNDNISFGVIAPLKNTIIKKVPKSENKICYFYGNLLNSKNKKMATVFVATEDNLYYGHPGPLASLNSISIHAITNMRVELKKSGPNLIIDSAGTTITIVLSTPKSPNNIINKINEIKSMKHKNIDVDDRNSNKSNFELIKELKELLDMGAITQEEFDQKKKELL